MVTKIIDNFSGRLTRDNIGDMNSGMAKYSTTFGADPFTNISNLTWLEQPTQIDAAGAVITDLIVAGKTRFESGISYLYAIGHTGRLYKIQVNDTTTHNPDFDTAVLLTTLTINTPTFKFGASLQFYGSDGGTPANPRIFVGHDLGVTKVNIDGTSEAFVGNVVKYKSNIPRPSGQFLGKLYFGNGGGTITDGSGIGSNLVEIDSTETVSNYAKFSPGFPNGTYVRDLDVNSTGTYLQVIVSYLNTDDMTQNAQRTNPLASVDSYKFLWNGIDTGYTSFESYNGYSVNSNTTFSNFNYTVGYDLGGGAIYSNGTKIVTLPAIQAPDFGAMFSTGNLLGFISPEYTGGFQKANFMFYGQYDNEVQKGLFRFLRMSAQAPETDIIRIPFCSIVSNLEFGYSFSSYTNNKVGSAKIYFSTVEVNSSNATVYRFYTFTTSPTGATVGSSGTAIGGVYETQQETSVKLFRNILKKRLKVYEIRVFTPPLVANNSFQIDIIGNDGNPIADGTYTFTVGNTDVPVGTILCKYNPQVNGNYSIGIRITNLGTKNFVIEKIEADIDEISA